MAKFNVVLSIPATVFAYFTVEAELRELLEQRLADQNAVDNLWDDTAAKLHSEVPEVDEMTDWKLLEIGPAY